MKVLHISSSIFGKSGKSRQLADHFLTQLQAKQPDVLITERDLNTQPVPHLDLDTFQSNLTQPGERSSEQQQQAELADILIEELRSHDLLVVGAPMYNLGIPSTLKAWFDNVARAGTTFKYTENGPVGLVEGVRVLVFSARGGAYAGTEHDLQTPHLQKFFGLLGITDVDFIYAEKQGMSDVAEGELNAAKAQIDAYVNTSL